MSDSSNTDDNSNLVDMDNLDAFEAAFFGKTPVATDEPKEAPVEDEDEIEDDALATDEDTDAPEDEPAEDDEPEDEDEPEVKPEPKPRGKKSFQDRINELTAKTREAERREAALLDRLNKLETRDEVKPKTEEPKPLRETLSAEAPQPDTLDEDGEPVYPLGEFDPKYIRDLTKFTIAEETKAAKAEEAKQAEQAKIEALQGELQSSWEVKIKETEKELPDLREKLADMEEAFQGIDPGYGEFLAATIMTCDNGPQLMYYLSQNIGEAQKIVASGPAAATLAIGRLDAKFTQPVSEEKRNTKKVSTAPKPPEARTRGSAGRYSTSGDTDDLDAFEREFFKRK